MSKPSNKLNISIITLFPNLFDQFLSTSIIKRAQAKGLVTFKLIQLRDFGEGQHQTVDDRPYGGGAGMVLKVDVLKKALDKSAENNPNMHVILTSAAGKTYSQAEAEKLSKMENIVIVCGHYEGVDQRFIDNFVDEELSIGDYVLTGGEVPAMVIADSVTRLVPNVLKKPGATKEESFSKRLLEYPHYTRPEQFEGESVPKVLLSGNHQEIKKWRGQKSLEKTQKVRPDLLKPGLVSQKG